ncbi:3,4-dihydroxy 2-butanone 4-phosphate synthase / GTP cyclohydrolase II [Prosthecobacter debontii]|uniref:Riboflavin biosynthesis protein RibBA n=1 Tax=Prosthecobacter debontii TaxID=48467 RepID=A0A1T4YRA9_9BACT|nr:bifunctional 3,4-dihydroxy-2-butanone-4-phosphate synthase/GTP cyclohydrolase II [Prosthecobacter debontii]SKB04299.1 3,4-dihydroxy 2-butanone 4-phosphate synthase / GTP cyclohydrolase II [Prosthecobacter debontii]
MPSKKTPVCDSVESVIADIHAGRMVIVTDDEDRENEGDLICAAEAITPEMVTFMVREGGGMLCVPVSLEIATQLNLESMVPENREAFRTDFTVTVDAAVGITTGISSADRARTIRLLADAKSTIADFVQPGHINPLVAKPGGVLRRAGHTEAAVDLCRLAGLRQAGVLIEIMNPDGTMARMPDLKKFAKKHKLKICSIADLIAYRRRSEKLVEKMEVVDMPTDFGTFKLHLYKSSLDGVHHVALVMGEIDAETPTLVRVHSECLTGDIFASRRCDCGSQLHAAMNKVSEAGRGVIIYMRGHEGRGIGLHGKIMAYKLQEQGLDTVEANLKLGFAMDLRDYGIGAQIISDLGVRKIRLMTNNPRKVVGLEGHKLEIVEQVPVISQPNPHNQKYLETKKKKLGHKL